MTQQAQLVFVLLLLFVIGFGTLAQRLRIPYPILLVIGGLGLSFLPRLPRIALNPDFVFLAVLPPLLFAAAVETSWRDFRYNLVSILSLAFGLVIFTVIGISYASNMLLPGFDWRLGLVLGAVVAPTDAIAATSIAKRVGLPAGITDVLEGESLVNDATGLLALEFATALIVTGHVPSFSEGLFRLFFLIAGGVAVGLLVGKLVRVFEGVVDNTPVEITLSLVTPYIAYMAAEALKCSGVLATVTAGLYIGRQVSYVYSSRVRIEVRSVWSTLNFVLNGIVFVLIGLQLPYILGGIRNITTGQLIIDAAEFSVVVVLLRLLWTFPGAYVSYFIRHRLLHHAVSTPPASAIFIVGWTGMRGVVSLAAAIAIPTTIATGQPFPARSEIIFLTFSAILVTLVFQGLTLPMLIKALGLAGADRAGQEKQAARHEMLNAALARLEELRSENGGQFDPIYRDFGRIYNRRLEALEESQQDGGEHDGDPAFGQRYSQTARELRQAERSAVLSLRKRNVIGDNVLRELERELDLLEIRYRSE